MNKTFSFSTGNLVVNEKSISFHQNGAISIKGANTINRENIGHVDKEPISILPKAAFILWLRVKLIALVIVVLGLFLLVSYKIELALTFGLIVFFSSAFLLFY